MEAGFDLRDHAAGDGAIGDQGTDTAGFEDGDPLAFAIADTIDIGEEDQATRAKRGRDVARDGVGVDVYQLVGRSLPAGRQESRARRPPG